MKMKIILFFFLNGILCDNNTQNNTTNQNTTNEPIDSPPWTNLFSVFMFRTGIYNPDIMVGNPDYLEIYSNRFNVSYDIFFNKMTEYLNYRVTPGQNQTVINNISNVITTNYLNDRVFPTNLSTTVFISFDVNDYISYMISVIDAVTNSSSPVKIPNTFKMNSLKTGGYSGNSRTQIQYITIPDSQIIPSIGLRFFKTDVCPKFNEVIAKNSRNPQLIDYYKNNFEDVISTWKNAFSNTLPYKCLFTKYDENDETNSSVKQNVDYCAFNITTDLLNPSKMVQAVDQFNFDYNVGLRDNLGPFYINGTRDRIQELKSFFLHELNTSSPIHASILLEPFFDLFITVSNAFISNATDATSVNTRKVNFMVFEVGEAIFANINKMLKFGYYTNDTFFEHYKHLPRIVNGYHLSFELWTRNLTSSSQEYQIRVKDYSTLMDRNYTLSEFSGILSEFMHNPILTAQERSYFCANTQTNQ